MNEHPRLSEKLTLKPGLMLQQFSQTLVLFSGSLLFSCFNGIPPTQAQIIPDATLPVNSTVTPQGNINQINGGTQAGGNLFHSFQEFSIPTGSEAFFNNSLDIQNIFSRVTGNSISNIDGLIRANGFANLFLLNPNGIVFGPNASLNIGGSFFASTASSIKFADGFEFSTVNPQTTPLLTVSVPIGLQFNGTEGDLVVRAGTHISTARESGDAGQLPNTAQTINTSDEPPYAISGTLADETDVDLYQIYLSAGESFQATTVDGTVVDTHLFLFDEQGIGVDANDTSFLTSDQSTLPFDEPFIAPADGIYYLGITSSGIRPYSEDGFIFFQGPGAELPVTRWNNEDGSDSGSYIIRLGSLSSSAGGLEVLPGKTLALVGGQVMLEGATLRAPGGRLEIGGLAAPGMVELTTDGSFGFGDRTANVLISDATELNVRAGGGGTISINGRNIEISDNSRLLAGIQSGFGSADRQSGNIEINGTESVTIANGSSLAQVFQETDADQGGSIKISTANLSVLDRSELVTQTLSGGTGGNIIINARDAVLFDNATARTPVAWFSEFESDALARGGDINIDTRSLTLRNNSELDTVKFGESNGGNINLSILDAILLDRGQIYSTVSSANSGNGGDINITTGSLTVLKGSELNASNYGGIGNAGNITINARESVMLDGEGSSFNGIYSTVEGRGIGNGGNINITTSILTLNRSRLATEVRTSGRSGNVNLNVDFLSMFDGSLIQTNSSYGEAGTVSITASDTIVLDTQGGGAAVIYSFSSKENVANGGDINIETGSLILRNGAALRTDTFGAGNAGNVTIIARDTVFLDGAGRSGFGNAAMERPSQINTITHQDAEGNGGNIEIIMGGQLLLTNGAQITASTTGVGNAGNVNIVAGDRIFLGGNNIVSPVVELAVEEVEEGTGIFSITSSEGQGGNINITTGSLFVTQGSQLQTRTEDQGNAGNITIEARDLVSVDGIDRNMDFDTLATSQINTNTTSRSFGLYTGNGGNIDITTGALSVTGGAQLTTATLGGTGNAGDITINARDNVLFDGIANDNNDRIISGAFSEADSNVGDGGNINITSQTIEITNGAALSASSYYGSVTAGNILLESDSIRLDNEGVVEASTAGGQGNIRLRSQWVTLAGESAISTNATGGESGGNIEVQTPALILRQGSKITTDAEGLDTSNPITGGNITLNADVLAALQNSDISANSDNFLGGTVTINSSGIFGTEFRESPTATSDITATGADSSLSGTVSINTPEIDPTSGLVELPTTLTDVAQQIDSSCRPGQQQSEFIVTGRGGLPPNPIEAISDEATWLDLRPGIAGVLSGGNRPISSVADASNPVVSSPTPPLVEAQGWVMNAQGKMELVAQGSEVTLQNRTVTPAACLAN